MKRITLEVEIGVSRYNTPQPRIRLLAAKETSARHLSAAMHLVAGKLELASEEARASWAVTCESDERVATVAIEMVTGDEREIRQAMAILGAVAEMGASL